MLPNVTRRRFGLTLCGASLPRLFAQSQSSLGPAVVAKVYLAAPQTHWPRPNLDLRQEAAEVDARLAEVESRHARDLRFTGGQTLTAADQLEAWAKSLNDVDAVLAIPLSTPSVYVPAVADAARRPTLCFSRPYAGHHWSGISTQRQSGGRKLDVLATSSYGGFDAYVPVFRAIHHMRRSKVLVSTARPDSRKAATDDFSAHFGTTFSYLSYDDLVSAFQAADAAQARREAEEFSRGALKVVEPKPKEVEDALRFYVAMRNVMQKEGANALTVDCFPALLAHKLPGYPCIAFSKLNDRGLYGVCEGDVPSTMTQILVTSYSGMPGFVSDPVFDTSRNEVIHAHCVAATRMKGIDGPSSPYLVRHHLETAEGASMQVLMPSNETITVGEFWGAKRFLVSTAEVTGTVAEVTGSRDAEAGCRSKIRTRVSDAEKWLQNYRAGLHRVIFYGDHVKGIERMGRLMNFEVLQEI